MRLMRLLFIVILSAFAGYVFGYHFALSSAPTSVRGVPEGFVRHPITGHWFMSTEGISASPLPGLSAATAQGGPSGWTEKDFQALLQWERDGIFPRIGYDLDPPDWYVAEKQRRGLAVKPGLTVTEEQFADPEFRRRYNR